MTDERLKEIENLWNTYGLTFEHFNELISAIKTLKATNKEQGEQLTLLVELIERQQEFITNCGHHANRTVFENILESITQPTEPTTKGGKK